MRFKLTLSATRSAGGSAIPLQSLTLVAWVGANSFKLSKHVFCRPHYAQLAKRPYPSIMRRDCYVNASHHFGQVKFGENPLKSTILRKNRPQTTPFLLACALPPIQHQPG